ASRAREPVEPDKGNDVKRKPRHKTHEGGDGLLAGQQPQRMAERIAGWRKEDRQEKTPASAVVGPRVLEDLRGLSFCGPANCQTRCLYLQLGVRHGCVSLGE